MKRFVVLALAYLLLTGQVPGGAILLDVGCALLGEASKSYESGRAEREQEARRRERERERDEILARAEQGDAEAQFRLALSYSSADERRKWLSLAANQGHAEAQFQLYTRDKPDGKSLTWLCLAANQGHALAQEERGDLHVQGLGRPWREAGLVKLDHVRAYMWYSLAAANGLTRAGSTRDYIADQMTPAQIAEAERLAAEWKPGDCGAEGSPIKSTG